MRDAEDQLVDHTDPEQVRRAAGILEGIGMDAGVTRPELHMETATSLRERAARLEASQAATEDVVEQAARALFDATADKPEAYDHVRHHWIHAYGSCPTQVSGNTLDGVPFYFRARYGRWELWAPYTSTEEVLVASGEDETYGSMHADDVDKIIDAHLGTGWTNGGVR